MDLVGAFRRFRMIDMLNPIYGKCVAFRIFLYFPIKMFNTL